MYNDDIIVSEFTIKELAHSDNFLGDFICDIKSRNLTLNFSIEAESMLAIIDGIMAMLETNIVDKNDDEFSNLYSSLHFAVFGKFPKVKYLADYLCVEYRLWKKIITIEEEEIEKEAPVLKWKKPDNWKIPQYNIKPTNWSRR